MKIDVRKCNLEKRYSGDLVFETEGDNSLIDIPFTAFSSPVRAQIRYEILEDDSVELTGKVRFFLKGRCSRCLRETEQSYSGEAEGCYSPVEGEEDYFYRGGVVDLSDFIRDAVLEALPMSLECGGKDCAPPAYKE